MVSKKREDPFTPDPKRGVQLKKMKEYMSPLPKTPLRNVLTPERNNPGSAVVQSGSKKTGVYIDGGLGSASRSRLSMSFEAINDDDGEKLLRREDLVKKKRERKTNLMSTVVGSSPKAAPPQSLSNSAALKKSTSNNSLGAHGNTPLAGVIASEMAARPLLSSVKQKMTAEQMNKVFEEWVKIAADNKINSKNTWNLALIDYFSELTFLRDGASINFQKASCTLDGCVKIYSSRVDSVVDETGKLMNGLAEGNLKNSRYLQNELGAENDSIDPEDEEEDENGVSKKKAASKKTSRHVNTLEKSVEALNLKQFDLEYAVDPLFKKTCAEFDESNSRGMLLHSLSLAATGQVIFDSSDSLKIEQQNVVSAAETNAKMDLSMIKSNFGAQLALMSGRKVCAAFADYSLSDAKNDKLVEDQLVKAMDRLSKVTIQPVIEQPTLSLPTQSRPNMMEVDGQVFDAPPVEDDYFAPLMDDDYGAYQDEEDVPAAFDNSSDDDEMGPLRDEEFTEEPVKGEGFSRDASKTENIFSYFDDSLKQAWAGPNHWKVRRPAFIRHNEPSTKSSGTKKKDFTLQFDESVEIDIEALFAKPANPATITLTKNLIEERSMNDNLLPEDLHFSSVNFLRLFIKPSWRFGSNATTTTRTVRLKPEMRSRDTNQSGVVEPSKEIQEVFWARNEAHPEGVADATNDLFDPDMNPDAMEGVDFDDDYGAYNSSGDEGDGLNEFSQAQFGGETQQSALTNFGVDLVSLKAGVQVQRLAFSRVAKRVDVHKLKQAIWEEIEEDGPSKKNAFSKTKFSQLVGSLDKSSYPKEGLRDVSIPYCFICLLHLANEQGLSINTDGNDLVVSAPSN